MNNYLITEICFVCNSLVEGVCEFLVRLKFLSGLMQLMHI